MTTPTRETVERIQEAPVRKMVLDKEFIGSFKAGDTTPSVLNVEKWKCNNTGPVTITYFDDGQDGQSLTILGDGNTTVHHDVTRIHTAPESDLLLSNGKVFQFTRFDGVWSQHA